MLRDRYGFIVLDIADGARPVEVSRLTISQRFFPHWTAWETPDSKDDNWLYLL